MSASLFTVPVENINIILSLQAAARRMATMSGLSEITHGFGDISALSGESPGVSLIRGPALEKQSFQYHMHMDRVNENGSLLPDMSIGAES
jgi:hypothetical protein